MIIVVVVVRGVAVAIVAVAAICERYLKGCFVKLKKILLMNE